MTIKVGFIGLGIMGKPMSKNLLKAGYSLVVSDRNPEAIADVIAAGGAFAATNTAEWVELLVALLRDREWACSVGRWPPAGTPGNIAGRFRRASRSRTVKPP